MKRGLLLLFCLISSFTIHANGKNVSTAKIDQQIKSDILRFFSGSLVEEMNDFTVSKGLKKSEVVSYQAFVWELWKEANSEFVEEKLIDLDVLSEKNNSQWNLPESLEPKAVMPYYWGTKGTEQPEEGYPLYLYLHGSGSKRSEWMTGLKICNGFDDAPSAYFIPQIPNEGEYYRWWQKAKQFAWEKLLRLAFLTDKIDANRVYFFGISEGGYGSQRLASFYADYLAGAGPMAGGEPLKNAPVENCRNIAFSLRTGDNDSGFYRNTLTSYVAEAFDSIQHIYPEDFKYQVELIPGMGHAIDYKPTTPWLKQFVRNPYPKHVNWENFEMDGRYRKGFYNLYVKEQSTTEQGVRSYYQMDIVDNTISLKVDETRYTTIMTDPNWGIEMKFTRQYTPAEHGKLTVYLCDELVNLSKKVTITVNGKKVFSGKVKTDLKHMVNSCSAFYDPKRIFPAAVEIEW